MYRAPTGTTRPSPPLYPLPRFLMMTRRLFAARVAAVGIASPLFADLVFARAADGDPITARTVREAETLAGLTLTDAQRESLVRDLAGNAEGYAAIRALDLPNSVPPATRFDPFTPVGVAPRVGPGRGAMRPEFGGATRPSDDTDLAFAGVGMLSHLIATRQVTSTELTRLFLDRLARIGQGDLKSVVRLTADRALDTAARMDAETAAGRSRGPLHGIPYGAKDLLAARGYPTEWGTPPFAGQTFDDDAEVVARLDRAGAVLVAKLSLGELAWGDVWTGGRTNNPWNVAEGSSGSSAGSAASVAAGLVPFAIGSETLGSIVSPSTRCGASGFRPTYGRVSRAGAMALSWTMDKLGPICRSAADCALVFDAIAGRHDGDASTRDAPFDFDALAPIGGLRIGVIAPTPGSASEAADLAAIAVVERLYGKPLRPLLLPLDRYPLGAMTEVLSVEGAAAFDALAFAGPGGESPGLDRMVRQTADSWPHTLRVARFVPAVEYIQMQRARTRLMEDVARAMGDLDVVVAPSFAPGLLAATNLTGHPCAVVPHAFAPVRGAEADDARRNPRSISFVGALDRDDAALHVAAAFQAATDWHTRRPPVGG